MKKIVVLVVAMASIAAAQAQEKRIPGQRKEFHDKMMAEKLKLSEEQRQKARLLNEEYRKKMTELRKKDDILVRDWKNQMMELNKKHREGMKGLLSNEQRAQVEKMKSERKKMAEIDANARMEKMKLQLDLTNEQTEKLKKQRIEMLEKIEGIRNNNSMDMMKKREEMKLLMEKRKEYMKSILNEDQLRRMQELNKSMHRKRRVLS